jgi:hypothetical protein
VNGSHGLTDGMFTHGMTQKSKGQEKERLQALLLFLSSFPFFVPSL